VCAGPERGKGGNVNLSRGDEACERDPRERWRQSAPGGKLGNVCGRGGMRCRQERREPARARIRAKAESEIEKEKERERECV